MEIVLSDVLDVQDAEHLCKMRRFMVWQKQSEYIFNVEFINSNNILNSVRIGHRLRLNNAPKPPHKPL